MSKIYVYEYEDWFSFAWNCVALDEDITKHNYAWCEIRQCDCTETICPRIEEFKKGLVIDESKIN